MAPAHDTRRSRRPVAGREPEPRRTHRPAARRRPVAAANGRGRCSSGRGRCERSPPRLGIDAVAWNDPRYPARLLTIPDCPPLLWYRGTLDALDRPGRRHRRSALGVGGRCRDCGTAGRRSGRARRHRRQRAGAGCRRRGTSRARCARGRTIAVMASGADRVYPAEHEALARDIAASGLVISEYAPGTVPLPFRFPQRNRVISALSDAVVVVEASERSGSLITAAVRARAGPRRDGRSGQRPRRPQPRRPRPHPGRGKDCGVLRTIS